jgi:hypothetical protein
VMELEEVRSVHRPAAPTKALRPSSRAHTAHERPYCRLAVHAHHGGLWKRRL